MYLTLTLLYIWPTNSTLTEQYWRLAVFCHISIFVTQLGMLDECVYVVVHGTILISRCWTYLTPECRHV